MTSLKLTYSNTHAFGSEAERNMDVIRSPGEEKSGCEVIHHLDAALNLSL